MNAPALRQDPANLLEERVAAAQRRVLWSVRRDQSTFQAALQGLQVLVGQLEQGASPALAQAYLPSHGRGQAGTAGTSPTQGGTVDPGEVATVHPGGIR